MFYQILSFFLPAVLLIAPIGLAQDTAVIRPESSAQVNPVLQLSLKQAADIALSPDGIRIAEELVRQARARSVQTRAALLPNIDASVGQQNVTRNLEAFGIRFHSPVPGFEFPTFVGPYNVFDARAAASLNVFNLSSIRRYQASGRRKRSRNMPGTKFAVRLPAFISPF